MGDSENFKLSIRYQQSDCNNIQWIVSDFLQLF